ncbi:two-component sensor histidine kinase BarA [Gallaecimonas kandeliae]|uniref:two-component sensor histidine kinase BarA n=1 Tax=Gallaecimonas kandeliae TaxID=3029055 RepID=UPI002648F6D5|nr:two-component sensor histidine kinase BarA [Gallaecimonas kandeliae]WKE66439.1 two-component sensor histidine kinase BarA [Gallaecimonas kandeliae]
MTKFGLRAWVLILTLAPTLLIGTLLGGYFTLQRYQEVLQHLKDQGLAVIAPLTVAAEPGLVLEDREQLKRLVSAVHRRNTEAIRNIAVYDKQGTPMVSSTFHRDFPLMKLPPGEPIPQIPTFAYVEGRLMLRAPIMADTSFYASYRDKIDPKDPVLGYVAIQLNQDSTIVAQHEALFRTLLIVFIGVMVHLLFTWRLLKHVTDPISNMVHAVDRIREGKLDTRVQGILIGELDTLKSGINAMAKSLDEYHADMQHNIDQATYDLRMTLEQVEIQNIELDKARKRAQEASQVKSEFLANMSHELRTPLNGVLGFARQLMKTQLTPSQTDYLQTIERSAQHLLAIINDVLDFSKLEAGKLKLDNTPYSFHDALYEVVDMMGANARDKGLELCLHLPPDTPDSLMGDALRLKQVLTNLVGNAVKFTQAGGVDIIVSHDCQEDEGCEIRVTVTDTGVGIDPKQQQYLFSAFAQADASITRRFGGTGLGLIISKTLVNQMKGQMDMESQVGKGSTFWFSLPVKKAAMVFHDPLPMAPLEGKTVALVGGSRRTRRMLTLLMESWPFSLQTTEDPALMPEADFVLLDQLEQQDLTALLARLDKPAEARIIGLSNHADPQVRERMLAQGLDICLVKPLTAPRLYRALVGEQPSQQLPALRHPSALPPLPPGRILVVDDNSPNLKLMSALLEDSPCEVHCANSGLQALEAVEKWPFDAIFMDIQMPGMDGVTAMGHIRERLGQGCPPIIAVTAHAMAGEREKLLEKGMDDYLTKPIDERTLHATLLRWLKKPVVLDWDQALRQAGGREALAKDMVKMLIDSLPQTREGLEKALAEADFDALYQAVHKFNGALAYTGTPRLKNLAHEIETQLKKGAATSDVEPEVFELIDEMDKLDEEVGRQGLVG